MPLYEYRCNQCGHEFEVSHQVGGTAGPCPVCGGSVRRIFSSVGLIFKGSGFHTTDYRKPASKDGAPTKGASTEGAAKESSKESSTESAAKSAEPGAAEKKE